MEDEMLKHNAIGACCSRPRFNFVGGVDDETRTCFREKLQKERSSGPKGEVLCSAFIFTCEIGRTLARLAASWAHKYRT